MKIKNPIIHNIYPDEVWKWQEIEKRVRQVAELYNFKEVRMSMLQEQETIEKVINNTFGQSDDLNLAELFYFIEDPNQLALRPENTVSILAGEIGERAKEEVQRVFYHGPVFRRELPVPLFDRVYEVGFEIIGNDSLIADIETMKVAYNLCRKLGFPEPEIHLTSYGCDKCRPGYLEKLEEYLKTQKAEDCVHCNGVVLFNPFKFTQCDREQCSQVRDGAPRMMDHLCGDCRSHLDSIQRILQNLMLDYVIDERVLRPFGYYNRTVFNLIIPVDGEDIVIGGGGRYDTLSGKIRGETIPAVGIALNQLQLIKIMERFELFQDTRSDFCILVSALDKGLDLNLLQIEQELHEQDFHTILESNCPSLACVRKKARQQQCSLAIILTESDIRRGKCQIINLLKDFEEHINLSDIFQTVLRTKRSIEIL